MKTSSLLGCGYLGFPLALNLLQMGYNVKGSTTTPGKIQQLKKAGIIPYLINLEENISPDFSRVSIEVPNIVALVAILAKYFSPRPAYISII